MPIRDKEQDSLINLVKKIQNGEIQPNENGNLNLYKYLPNDIHKKIISAFDCIEKWFNKNFGKYENNKSTIDTAQLNCFEILYTQKFALFL